MKLSNRLLAVASMVTPGGRIADVGTDHGYIPIWLVEQGTAVSALAMDVREGPLLRAKEHIAAHKLENVIETRLSDGLQNLKPGEADTVIIAGMGGELMLRIIREGSHMWDRVSRWVLSPQSELSAFRHGLEELGFLILREEFLEEDGKYYTVMEVCRGQMHWGRELLYRYGADLLEKKHPVLLRFLQKEEQTLLAICGRLEESKSNASGERLREMRQELNLVREAYDEMQRTDSGA